MRELELPIVKALETAETGKRLAITRHLSFEAMSKPMTDGPFRHEDATEVRSEARFVVVQIAANSGAIPHLHKQATRMLMHEIYGPVEQRLLSILHKLWEAGPRYDDEIAEEIDELIRSLRA